MRENEHLVFDGFHKIMEFDTKIKDKIVKRERLIVKSAVAGIVIDENDKIGLVSQYRPIIQRNTKEIPAGVLDKEGMTEKEILIEELYEECGITSEEILSISEKPIHRYFMIAGNADAEISIYLIRVKKQKDKLVDDADVQGVEWVDTKTMKQYIETGLIADGKTILAYYVWNTSKNH